LCNPCDATPKRESLEPGKKRRCFIKIIEGFIDMEYSVGHTGRVILLRLDEDEDILESLESLASKENIESGIFFVIGSLKEGSLVSGAKTDELPVIPILHHLTNNHEVLGIGNIFQMEGQPKIHLHAALARGDKVLLGCLREKSKVFLVEEIIIFELLDLEAIRETDQRTGLLLLKIH
jgi:predicted DNA-binding protein with PD1-like motif